MSTPNIVSTKQLRIAELAKQDPMMAINVSHHMDLDWFKEAYRRTRKSGAAGVDGETAEDFAVDLVPRLEHLISQAKSGNYRAPAVKRVHIPKGNGTQTRPLGIPTFEDKVLQRAVVMALNPIFEQDFLDCSYGFRPGRSAHQALDALWKGLMDMGGGCIIDLDIKGFFDTVDKKQVQELVRRRVRDGVVRRLIGKWLNAGVFEEGQITHADVGVPQGGVISPLLSNIYLHEVLDTWFANTVLPLMRGGAFIVRYADDAVLAFEHRSDAMRVLKVLGKRFAKYGLELHPEKTRLVDFQRGKRRATFDFLGFTYYWTLSRKGRPVIKRKTSGKSMRRSLTEMNQWLRSVRHWKIGAQHRMLCRKIQGHIQYYGITANSDALSAFVDRVKQLWVKWVRRRSHHGRHSWQWFSELLHRFPLPPPTPVHSLYVTRAKP